VLYQMYVGHAHRTRAPHRRVTVKQVVRATLDVQEATVEVAVRVWLANTQQPNQFAARDARGL